MPKAILELEMPINKEANKMRDLKIEEEVRYRYNLPPDATFDKEMLERIKKLEAVAEATREYFVNCTDYGTCDTLNDEVNCFANCPKDKIKQALAELDGDDKEVE